MTGNKTSSRESSIQEKIKEMQKRNIEKFGISDVKGLLPIDDPEVVNKNIGLLGFLGHTFTGGSIQTIKAMLADYLETNGYSNEIGLTKEKHQKIIEITLFNQAIRDFKIIESEIQKGSSNDLTSKNSIFEYLVKYGEEPSQGITRERFNSNNRYSEIQFSKKMVEHINESIIQGNEIFDKHPKHLYSRLAQYGETEGLTREQYDDYKIRENILFCLSIKPEEVDGIFAQKDTKGAWNLAESRKTGSLSLSKKSSDLFKIFSDLQINEIYGSEFDIYDRGNTLREYHVLLGKAKYNPSNIINLENIDPLITKARLILAIISKIQCEEMKNNGERLYTEDYFPVLEYIQRHGENTEHGITKEFCEVNHKYQLDYAKNNLFD